MYQNQSQSKDYATQSVTLANVYDPVKYMLANQRKRSIAMMDGKIERATDENEGGLLIRNGYFLEKVEGNRFYDYLLFYNIEGLLENFFVLHKETGKSERWSLHFVGGMLSRYDYEVVNEGSEGAGGAEDGIVSSDMPYDGGGEMIDYDL